MQRGGARVCVEIDRARVRVQQRRAGQWDFGLPEAPAAVHGKADTATSTSAAPPVTLHSLSLHHSQAWLQSVGAGAHGHRQGRVARSSRPLWHHERRARPVAHGGHGHGAVGVGGGSQPHGGLAGEPTAVVRARCGVRQHLVGVSTGRSGAGDERRRATRGRLHADRPGCTGVPRPHRPTAFRRYGGHSGGPQRILRLAASHHGRHHRRGARVQRDRVRAARRGERGAGDVQGGERHAGARFAQGGSAHVRAAGATDYRRHGDADRRRLRGGQGARGAGAGGVSVRSGSDAAGGVAY
eukprot:ctg_172.g110